MSFNTLFALLVLLFVCLATAQVPLEDCCLSYNKGIENRVRRHAVSYRVQVTDGGCNIPAVIFKMRRGRILCVDPNAKWSREVMKMLDACVAPKGTGKNFKKLCRTRS
ncbi:C-C motif chemokine 25 [Nelusetta ayraudi]|uniref:C-C motif chemokine 25 n=1 Tax=Nelusetta ayraudi TaxID=303726 RepID=UPI003F6EE194